MPRLKAWEAVVAAGFMVAYWVIVLAIPSEGAEWPAFIRWTIGLVGGVLVLAGAAGILVSILRSKMKEIGLFALLGLGGVVLFIVGLVTGNRLDLTDGRRLAIGVGGIALAGLVYGVTRFDTIRAAASVPIIMLLIGVATWPDATTLIGTDVRTEIIKWTGVVLAAAGAGEAAKQVGESIAGARSDEAPAKAPGDLASVDREV